MPLVSLTVGPKLGSTSTLRALVHACAEFVPAALNTEQGPLRPDDVEVTYHVQEFGISTDVVVKVEALFFEDRLAHLQERTENIRRSLSKAFGDISVSVLVELVDGSWSSTHDDTPWSEPVEKLDMSIEAAMNRFYGHPTP